MCILSVTLTFDLCVLEPYKPCSLEDDERVEKCKKLKDLETEKNNILNRDDLFGVEKYFQHTRVFDVGFKYILIAQRKMLVN